MPSSLENETRNTSTGAGECMSCDLMCQERVKYSCGQLLTDGDLNTDQRYYIEKNKIHNRYLHGWGVVCGLKVLCHPKCGTKGNVLIEKGYALDCCGNDIIVCKDQELDLLAKIKDCQPKPERDECLPGAPSTPEECKDLEKKYCLILNYKEEVARPVTALKRDEEGCSVKRCEPSRIKEGYSFEVKECRDCSNNDNNKDVDSMLKNIAKCVTPSMHEKIQVGQRMMGMNIKDFSATGHDSYKSKYCDIKIYIKDMLMSNSVRCNIESELDEITFPEAPAAGLSAADKKIYQNDVNNAFSSLLALLFQKIVDCICLQILNNCPECEKDDKVVLACVTVQNDKIKHICNLARRQVMSFPKLFYWFPINEMIKKLVVKLCCELDIRKFFMPKPGVTNPAVAAMPAALYMNKTMMSNSYEMMSSYIIERLKISEGISAGHVYNKKINDAEKLLKDHDIKIIKRNYDELERIPRLKNLWSSFEPLQPGSTMEVFKKDDKVIFARKVEDKIAVDEAAINKMNKMILKLDEKVTSLSATMKIDPQSLIIMKSNIEKPYQPLTIEIVKAISEKKKPSDFKEISAAKEKKLKRAGINSSLDMLEIVPVTASSDLKEPIDVAIGLRDLAEKDAINDANVIYKELKKLKIKDKKDLKKLDTAIVAKAIGLRKAMFTRIINKIIKE